MLLFFHKSYFRPFIFVIFVCTMYKQVSKWKIHMIIPDMISLPVKGWLLTDEFYDNFNDNR